MAIKTNPYADDNGNLNNPKNRFIKETNKISRKEYICESINSIKLNNSQVSNEINSILSDYSKKENRMGK